MGQEERAIPFYEKSIKLGLDKIYLEEAYLVLGSIYRVTGDYQKSFELLKIDIQEFPQNNALLTFYSMTLYNLGRIEEAMEILLQLLATTSTDTNIQDFSKAILFYYDKLNQTWLAANLKI